MFDIKEIAHIVSGEILGDENLKVDKLAPFFDSKEDNITFAFDEKYLKKIMETKAKVVLVPNLPQLPQGKTFIKVNGDSRKGLIELLKYFKPKTHFPEDIIEKNAIIGDNAKVGKGSYIGHNSKIGDGTLVYPNVTILSDVSIGKNCIIYPNVTIREYCKIGDNVIIQPGAVVGSDGFGYININGIHEKLEQIGCVILEDNVEIGANTTIDRGAVGDTVIKSGTKIDNLVHIAHNDIIGNNCLIIAQVGISGSVEVGDNCIIAGQSGVAGHLKIGNNVIVAAKSGVTNDIADNSKVSGFPLREHKEDLKIKIAMTKLPELLKRVKAIEKTIGGEK